MNEVDLIVEDLAMKLANAELNASVWRARAIEAGFGQEDSEDINEN